MRRTPWLLLAVLLSAPVIAAPPAPPAPAKLPVLCVHGIDDRGAAWDALRAHLTAAGWRDVEAIDLHPNHGEAPLEELAAQVAKAADALRARTGSERIDLVAFSMGTLVSRIYLQRLGGRAHVRKFVSLSGPHHGTWMAYFRDNAGARQMRPGSELLNELARTDRWDGVEVFSIWTPLDLMILPADSARLPGATARIYPVAAHPLMLLDGRVLEAVEAALGSREVPRSGPASFPAWP